MEEAVVVSYARTALAKSFRGGFNATHGAALAATAVRAAVERACLNPAEVDDLILGCGFPEGATGMNIARQAALAAGLPESVPGMTVNRFCASGVQALAIAAHAIQAGAGEIFVAGGVESISCVQPHMNTFMLEEASLKLSVPGVYWPMLQTAEALASRAQIPRSRQDEFGVRSQLLAHSSQRKGVWAEEIVPLATTMVTFDAQTKQPSGSRPVVVDRDEGIRPDTTLEGVGKVQPSIPDGVVTAGNASQFSDGAAALVVMSRTRALQLNLRPLGVFRALVATGCSPEVMGIGPALAVPKLLRSAGLSASDIDLWEINEAFAVQTLYCVDELGIPLEKLNVNGGAIALGHPYGVSGARLVGSGLLELRRRGGRRLVVTMCVAQGMGVAALLEAC